MELQYSLSFAKLFHVALKTVTGVYVGKLPKLAILQLSDVAILGGPQYIVVILQDLSFP